MRSSNISGAVFTFTSFYYHQLHKQNYSTVNNYHFIVLYITTFSLNDLLQELSLVVLDCILNRVNEMFKERLLKITLYII